MKRIYLDHSATTPLDPRVLEAMMPFLKEEFGNPSSLHSYGRSAKVATETAREKVAALLGAGPGEIVITAGGSEADNLAILGAAHSEHAIGKHCVTNRAEHHAVFRSFEELERQGFEVTYVPCDEYGMIHSEEIEKAIRPDTCLISVMHVNNEVGTINPIKEIGAVARKHGVIFHVDAVQAYGKIPIDVESMCIDLLSISAHKLYGPKGVGALYVRGGLRLHPLILGGSQERGRRAGTENTASIVGFGKAAEICGAEMDREAERLKSLQNLLWKTIRENIRDPKLNGHPEERLPGHLNISLDGLMGDEILTMLDLKGIAVSTGSACTSGAVTVSHVLTAMRMEKGRARSAIRLTLGRGSKEEDIPYVVEALKECTERMKSV